jgi:hypothetical protein
MPFDKLRAHAHSLIPHGSAQPAQQGVAASHDLLSGAKLVVGVRLGGITWSEIDRWDSH